MSSSLFERKLSVSSLDVLGLENDALIGVAGTLVGGCVIGATAAVPTIGDEGLAVLGRLPIPDKPLAVASSIDVTLCVVLS